MVLDTSAIVAILLAEPEREEFLAKIDIAERCFLSASTFVEAAIVMRRKKQEKGMEELLHFQEIFAIELVPFDDEQALLAAKADWKYGKGRGSKASLNLGDCFTYALAKQLDEPLLFKGDDFVWTDVVKA
jgi:ribonuclease VapC